MTDSENYAVMKNQCIDYEHPYYNLDNNKVLDALAKKGMEQQHLQGDRKNVVPDKGFGVYQEEEKHEKSRNIYEDLH